MRIFCLLIAAASVAAAQSPFPLPPLSPATQSRIAGFVAGADLGPLLDDANTLAELIERESAIASARRSTSLQSAAGLLRARRADTLEGLATSLVARAGLADLVTAAIENGAFARDHQGLRTTFRFNAFGLHRLFSQPAGRSCAVANPLCDTPGGRALRGLSASVTVENQASAAALRPLSATLRGGRVAAAGLRFQSFSRRTPDVESFRAAVARAAAERGERLRLITGRLDEIWDDEKLNAAMHRFRTRLERDFARLRADAPPGGEPLRVLVEAYQRALAELAPVFGPGFLEPVRLANLNAERALAQSLSAILLKPAFSVELSHQAPLGQAPTAQVRYALDTKLWKNGGNYDGLLTLNGGATVYERLPAGLPAQPWRDAQLALQFDRKLGASSARYRPVFSLAAFAQYQFGNAVLNLESGPAEALNTRGLIAVVQGKLTLRLGSALTLPFSFSWANRTELVKAPHLRTQLSLLINLDSLVAKE